MSYHNHEIDLSAPFTYMESEADSKSYSFGHEIECTMWNNTGVDIGYYHNGIKLMTGTPYRTPDGREVYAPAYRPYGVNNTYGDKTAKAESDSSIDCRGYDRTAVEFVSPVLKGEAGRAFILHLYAFIKALGGKVNASCGGHIHIGIESVTGDRFTEKGAKNVTRWIATLGKYGINLQHGFYALTGSASRPANYYSRELSDSRHHGLVPLAIAKKAKKRSELTEADMAEFEDIIDRGSFMNLTHVTSTNVPTIEFRFACGTLNPNKFLNHLFAIEWLCALAWEKRNAPDTKVKYKGDPRIHSINNNIRGRKTLRDMITKIRMSKTGKALLASSNIYKERWVRMWSIGRRMAEKFDKGFHPSYDFAHFPEVEWKKEPHEGFDLSINA